MNYLDKKRGGFLKSLAIPPVPAPLSPAIAITPIPFLKGVAGRGDARTEFAQVVHEAYHEIPVQYPASDFLRIGVGYVPYDALILVQ